MSKLSAVDGQLQQCEKCQQSEDYTVIGKLSFCTNCDLGYGDRAYFRRSFTSQPEIYGGDVYRGKFEGIKVAVERLRKQNTTGTITTVKSETLLRVDVHHRNIVRYYTMEQDDDYWYV